MTTSVARHRGRCGSFTSTAGLLVVCGASAFLFARQARTEEMESRAKETEAKIKVAYIYNLPKFVDWPADEKPSATEPLRICMIGADPIRTVLGELSIRKVNERPIEVVQIKDPHALPPCHLLYISRSEERQLSLVLQSARGTPILTVSDIPQFAHQGGMIGFVTEEDRVKIEINQSSVHEAGLKLRAKLIEIARLVQ
jgi:hypothetical protein